MVRKTSEKGSATPRCPICGKPAEARWRPFCSRRCADIDLGRWLRGGYAIPGEEGEVPDGPEGGEGMHRTGRGSDGEPG